MKTCAHCNLSFPDDKSFCNKCGRSLEYEVKETTQSVWYPISIRDTKLLLAILLLDAFIFFAKSLQMLFYSNWYNLLILNLSISILIFTIVAILLVKTKALKVGLVILLVFDLLRFLIYELHRYF